MMIADLSSTFPVDVLCTTLDCPRSSYYYQAVPSSDDALVTAIEQIVIRWPRYGYRRVTAQLQREGWTVNSKVVRRLMQEFGLHCRMGHVRLHTTDSTHGFPRFPNLVRDLVAVRPDHIWVADITYIRLGTGFVYLAVILDVFTRAVRGWHLGRSLGHELALSALQMALRSRVPQFHHSDQGVQYAARGYVAVLQERSVQISMADVGQPTQNAYAERFMRTLKEEHVDYAEYRDVSDARAQMGHWLEVEYMQERIHSALAYATPAEFEAAFWGLFPRSTP
ncbi:MAG: Mobile element protein [uncultured Chloroflexia bacterium]|uniref:Mobile element protein n=1 Tax=uncultured Chloroflexia bacterium TaxID=1672391 RepID=A0A6J4KQB1_9CHLR|nr:MAG: Mobile element protein [uncultured Chloroflexia bacterium]